MPSLRNRKGSVLPVVISVAAAIVLTAAIFLYSEFDPAGSVFWPKCPFHLLTGLECPGCGSQRAVHSLLNGDLLSAVAVFCRKAEMVLYHGPAVRVILAVILLFWLLRNFTSSF